MSKGKTHSQSSNKSFLKIIAGKFRQTVKEGTEGAIARYSEKAKKTFHELEYDYVEGMIEKMEYKKTDFGQVMEVTLNCAGEINVVSLPVETEYFKNFVKRLPNVEPNVLLRMEPYSFKKEEDKERVITGITMIQNEKKLPVYWTRENAGALGMPVVNEAEKNDHGYWKMYYLQVDNFLYRYADQWAKKNLKETAPAAQSNAVSEDDDLPF